MMPSSRLDLPGRVLVCGAAGGIGGAVAGRLRAAGTAVLGTDRGTAPADWTGAWTAADLADTGAYPAIAAGVDGVIDGLVLAAGVLDPAEWDRIDPVQATRLLTINLVAPYFVLRELLPKLAPGAAIVVVGSVAGLRGSPATPFYAASKAGLRNLAASLALLLLPRGQRVNVVAPGLIDTPLTDALNVTLAQLRGLTVPAIAAERAAAIPAGRAGSVDEIADACLYLLSRQSSYLSGSTLFATGGVLAGIT